MTKIEKEVKKLKEEYTEKVVGPGANFFVPDPDPFRIFFGYPGGDWENEKKFLLKCLEEEKMLFEFEEFCGYVRANKYQQYLIEYGYHLNNETNRMEIVWNNKVYVELDDQCEPSVIGMDYYITTSQKLNIRYIIAEKMWKATFLEEQEDINLYPYGEKYAYEANPKDAYAYLEEGSAINMALELKNLAIKTNVSMNDLKGGDPLAIQFPKKILY